MWQSYCLTTLPQNVTTSAYTKILQIATKSFSIFPKDLVKINGSPPKSRLWLRNNFKDMAKLRNNLIRPYFVFSEFSHFLYISEENKRRQNKKN